MIAATKAQTASVRMRRLPRLTAIRSGTKSDTNSSGAKTNPFVAGHVLASSAA
jgi:hypothetical protein